MSFGDVFGHLVSVQGALTPQQSCGVFIGNKENDTRYLFAVTRDSALVVFGHRIWRYGRNGECPPHAIYTPYRGTVDTLPRNGWCVRVFDENLKDGVSLRGACALVCTDILIHTGLASDYGCFVVAGGRSGFATFKKHVQRVLCVDEQLYVYVDERPEEHHTRDLSR